MEFDDRAAVWVVDRVEETVYVCENQEGDLIRLSPCQLPEGAREGDVLTERDGEYRVDPVATIAREKKMRQRLARLLHPEQDPTEQ